MRRAIPRNRPLSTLSYIRYRFLYRHNPGSDSATALIARIGDPLRIGALSGVGSATNVYKRPRLCEVDPTRPLALASGQLFEQGLRLLKVGGVEAFSERFVNW